MAINRHALKLIIYNNIETKFNFLLLITHQVVILWL